jgi:hypothetical protein
VSTINDGLADLGFGGTLTDATPLATQGGERRGRQSMELQQG